MTLVTRASWRARTPNRRTLKIFSKPTTCHWNGPTVTVGGELIWDHSKCASLVRGIQNFHMDTRGWDDIAYNFIECPHGHLFEGRGLNVVNAANGTNLANTTSHAIMCLGGEDNSFSDIEKLGFREAVKYVADHTPATEECVGHRDHKSTACPGNERYEWIRRGMPVSSDGTNLPVLKLGSRGDAVRWAQTIIRDKAGGNLFVDGIFGTNTEKRVQDVQRFFNLTPDGIVGPKTWGILNFLASS